jgi:predicted ArsR family transcriptional regulator
MSWFGSIYEKELPHRAKAVYMYLKDRSDGKGESWYAINTIAADLKLSRSTVKRALRDLTQAGQVEKQARYRKNGSRSSNLYRLK